MDRRYDDRYPVNLQATVADLSSPDRAADGEVVDVSQSGIGMVIPVELACGSIVKVQIGDCALFGQVSYCAGDGTSFRTGIEVVRVLIGESDFSRMVNAILVQAMPATPGVRASVV